MHRGFVVATTIVWFFGVAAAWPQRGNDTDAVVSIQPRPRPGAAAFGANPANIRVSSNLVLIPVSVRDARDRMVVGLEKERFKIYDDDVEQRITHFAAEDAPISVAFVFDTSASMGRKLRESREAISEVLAFANPEDEFALIQFNSKAHLAVPLTHSVDEIQNRLMLLAPKGRTALLDAIYLAVSVMRKAHNQRKAIVILSDGGDNSSRYSLSEVKSLVREADVQIFAIGILESFLERRRSSEEYLGPGLLTDVAQETGGQMFSVFGARDLGEVGAQIGRTLRNEYLIGYSPTNIGNNGKYHRVQLLIESAERLHISWRAGYVAPEW